MKAAKLFLSLLPSAAVTAPTWSAPEKSAQDKSLAPAVAGTSDNKAGKPAPPAEKPLPTGDAPKRPAPDIEPECNG
ncbi:MAG: hypothetical protein NUV55_13610 [Sulfuricaulis sp.]|uniref:hypothetical protein n=1 Tax=Sulfuricaulis sp. TaxID=2003553 RepID=UPI0025FB97C2|nr:hypothetical protein [Sulfuricaulis sp.]MCR4348218.1 hypothetical protein [Sulfuricaulis sp.]